MTPVLWSFRRCPYAMRARLAVVSSGVDVALREIVLRDKPAAFLGASPSGTVPCLETDKGVIDESLDIMVWALHQRDPEMWLTQPQTDLIETCDGPFKTALDHYKYPTRYEGRDPLRARTDAATFLHALDQRLTDQPWVHGAHPKLDDMALLPFIRQYAHVDLEWFTHQPWPNLIRWLEAFKTSDRFKAIMIRYPPWQANDMPVTLP